jgi:hypothetical protein
MHWPVVTTREPVLILARETVHVIQVSRFRHRAFAAHAGLVWGALGYLNEACHVLAPLPCNGVERKVSNEQGT